MPRRATVAYLVATAILLTGSVLCLVGSGMLWGTAQRAGLAGGEVVVTGGDLVPAGQAVGLLGLAAVVAIHATRRWGRRLIGLVLAASGLAVLVQTYRVGRDLADHVLRFGEAGARSQLDGAASAWGGPIVMAAGAAAVAAAGVTTAVWGPRWPSIGKRYERSAATRGTQESGDRAAWDALDRGEDPTV